MPSWTMKHLNRSQQCTKNSSRRLVPVAEQYLASLLTSAAFAFFTTAVLSAPIPGHLRLSVYNLPECFLPWNINLPTIMAPQLHVYSIFYLLGVLAPTTRITPAFLESSTSPSVHDTNGLSSWRHDLTTYWWPETDQCGRKPKGLTSQGVYYALKEIANKLKLTKSDPIHKHSAVEMSITVAAHTPQLCFGGFVQFQARVSLV